MAKTWESKHTMEVEEGTWYEYPTSTIHYNWCCDCHLRHIEEYRIVKNKSGQPTVQKRSWRDSYATELRRHHNKLKKQPTRRRKR